jgi:resuscitation-promoting factor RpfA
VFSANPDRPPELVHRTTATLALAVATLGPLAILAVVTPATWAAATGPDADAGALLAGLAAAAGWVVVLRLVVTALAVAVASLPGALGRLGRQTATTLSPAMARGLVRAALGAAVVSAPILAQPGAFADQPAYPILDRVIAAPALSPATPAHPAAGAARAPGAPGSGHVVLVRPGDTLWAIAAAHLPPRHSDAQVAQAWPAWYAANRQRIGPDPDEIRPGTRLVPPGAAG